MPCGWFPDIGNTCHCHWTWYLPMKKVLRWMLLVVQPEVFQLPLWCLLGFVVLFLYTLVARVCAFFRPLRNILMVAASLRNLHLLASHLNL